MKSNNDWNYIQHVNTTGSKYFATKNRNPILLDFQFCRYIYKNDDQLPHELISMEFIKYLNEILPSPIILEYDIIPEKTGAFYEFV